MLLRAAVGAWAAYEGGAHVLGAGSANGNALLSGGRALSWIPAPDPYLIGTHAGAWFVTIVAIGVALLGPGAYSIDSYLFGRREIIIPPAHPAVHE
jgi:hypothetical protein